LCERLFVGYGVVVNVGAVINTVGICLEFVLPRIAKAAANAADNASSHTSDCAKWVQIHARLACLDNIQTISAAS
jgi:hypothetical protein